MGYTRQLGQLAYLITFDGSGNITVPASLTQGSVTSSMLKADVGGKLVAAVAGTDFVAPAGLSAYVPTTRTLTINGTSYDLSADRSWTIVSGVSSFNTRTGAITLLDTDVTGALGYTPVTNARTLTINGTTYDLSANRSWSIVAGISSFNTRTGDITLLDTDVTGALGYTPVTNARTITINGTTYDLSANRTWVVDTSSVTTRVIQKFTATSSQTTFTITGGYTVGMVDVFLNGIKLDNATEFTASNGSTVVLALGAATGDIVEVYKYGGQFIANNTLRQSTLFTATAGQTTFTVNYSVGFVDVFYNGSKLDSSEFTATNGTSIVLGTACVLNDKVEIVAYNYTVGAFTGVGGSGTTNYISKWTASGTLGNSLIFDSGSFVGINNTTPQAMLDVYIGSVGTYFRGGSDNVARQLKISSSTTTNAGDTHTFDAQSGTGVLAFATTSTEKMRIIANGYVGINTSNPGATLPGGAGWVSQPSKSRILQINSTDGYANSGLFLRQTDNSTGLDLWSDNYYGDSYIDSRWNDTSGRIYFRLRTNGTPVNAMSITASGNVLINKTNISGYNLEVNGSGYFDKSDGTYVAYAHSGNVVGYVGTANQVVSGGSTGNMGINATNNLIFSTGSGSPERMRITSGGQINTPYQPAFFAIGLPSDLYANYGAGPITFSSAPTNRGSHWNGSRFTAPVAGIYYMAFESMYSHRGGDISFRVLKNGSSVSYSNPHTVDNAGNYPPWSQSTTTWVGTLAAGDYIEFSYVSSNNASTFIYAGGLYTKVYGYMIG